MTKCSKRRVKMHVFGGDVTVQTATSSAVFQVISETKLILSATWRKNTRPNGHPLYRKRACVGKILALFRKEGAEVSARGAG